MKFNMGHILYSALIRTLFWINSILPVIQEDQGRGMVFMKRFRGILWSLRNKYLNSWLIPYPIKWYQTRQQNYHEYICYDALDGRATAMIHVFLLADLHLSIFFLKKQHDRYNRNGCQIHPERVIHFKPGDFGNTWTPFGNYSGNRKYRIQNQGRYLIIF